MARKFPEIRLGSGFCILLSLSLLLVPLPWILAAVGAAGFHEFCHILALWGLKGNIGTVLFGPFGAEIRTGDLTWREEFLATAAGPAGSLLLALAFLHTAPRLAICGLCQGVYNLLPLYPLDGGRVLRCLLVRGLGPKRGMAYCVKIRNAVLYSLLLLGIFFSIYPAFRLLPGAFSLLLFYKVKKTPCQDGGQAVQ